MLASLLMISSGESKDRLLMYDFVMPFLSKESVGFVDALTSEYARAPIAIVFVGISLFYQLYWKKDAYFNPNKGKEEEKFDKNNPAHIMKGFKDHARKHGKLTPKMQRDMAEIELMMENMNKFGDKVNENLNDMTLDPNLGLDLNLSAGAFDD